MTSRFIAPRWSLPAPLLAVPGDKSISHRAAILGALAEGSTVIRGFLKSEDCLNTLACFEKMGVAVSHTPDGGVEIKGKGLNGLTAPEEELYVGNSGTGIRLLAGVLAGQSFDSVIGGDASVNSRPMKRVIDPLVQMGARIDHRKGYAPLKFLPASLKGITYTLPMASAQVKSCVLLAGLFADGPTTIIEPTETRDHSERMLTYFGADLQKRQQKITLNPGQPLKAREVVVPGDISSAAFFIVAGLILKDSEITLQNVGNNPTRNGIISVLKNMGAQIKQENNREQGEPSADLVVTSSDLKATEVGGEIIPNIIDEIPILAVAAAFSEGTTVIRDAAELRVKESDRIAVMSKALKAIGAEVEELDEGLMITGQETLPGGKIETHGDHRVAMALAVAALRTENGVEMDDADCVNTSFPGFFELLT